MSTKIQNKLFNYEEDPPPELWNEISEVLNEKGLYSKKLYLFEQEPPSITWQKIEKQFTSPTKVKTFQFYNRFSKQLKYVAIVAVFIITSLFTLFISKKTKSNETANLPLSLSHKIEKTDISNFNKSGKITVNFKNARILLTYLLHFSFDAKEFNNRASIEDRYLVFKDIKTRTIKVSNKIINNFQCTGNEENCKRKIINIQNQLSSHVMTSGFEGMIDMIKQIKEIQ